MLENWHVSYNTEEMEGKKNNRLVHKDSNYNHMLLKQNYF